MQPFADESLTDEQVDDLAVRVVRAVRAERAGRSWSVRQVADYLGLSPRHVRRLLAAGEMEGTRDVGSNAWAVPVRSMLAFEDRWHAARATANRPAREAGGPGVRAAPVP